VLWALAALWHLLGNPGLGPSWAQAGVLIGVVCVVWRPGSVLPLVTLAAASLVLLWEEAPILGNHWLLTGFVDLAVLLAFAGAVLRRRATDPIDMAERLFPAARLCLLGFYMFAGFAKLNSAFFDRSVSCAAYFFRESTSSMGFDGPPLGGAAWLDHAVIGAIVVIELSIPVLLIVRRTRSRGVVLAMAFHAVLAIDRTHEFYDFSAVLFALFVLFLPASAGTWVAERVGSARARLALRGVRLPVLSRGLLAAVVTSLGLLVIADGPSTRFLLLVGWWPWQAFALLAVATTVRFLRQRPPAAARGWLVPHHVLYAVIPLMVILNGLTPYLELKTAYGWNMYANLRTVGGESNHLLLPRTVPIGGGQDEVVEIIRSSDPALESYANQRYGLAWRSFRIYLARHPDVAVTYELGGDRVTLQHAADRPALVAAVPIWEQKLLLYRAVDLTTPERCLPAFGPAR
jgi:hypothetical protein